MSSRQQQDQDIIMSQEQNLTYTSPFKNDTLECGSDDDEQDKEVLLLKCKNAIEDLHYELERVQNENHQQSNKIANLEQDYDELQEQAKQTVQNYEYKLQEIDDLKSKNQNLQERIQMSSQDNEIQKQLENKYQDMKEKFQDMCDLNTMQKITIEEQSQELQNLKKLQEEWQVTLDNISQQTNDLSVENEELKLQIKQLDEKLIQQENINRIVEDSNYEFKQNTQKLQEQIQDLQQAIDQAENINKQNLDNLEQKYIQEINQLNIQKQEAEQDFNNIQESMEIQRKQFDDMQSKYQEKDSLMNIKVQNTEEEMEGLKQLHNEEMHKLQQIVDEQNSIIQQYELVVDSTKGQSVDKKYLTDLAEKNGYLTNRLEECQKEIKRLMADMELQFQNEDCKTDYLEKKVVELEVILQQRDISIQQYMDELNFFKSKDMQNGQQIPYFQRNIQDLQESINVKDKLLSKINQEKTQLMHENRQFKQENQILSTQVKELDSSLQHQIDLKQKQDELIKTFQEKSNYLEQVNNENLKHLSKEIVQKDQQISELRHRYDSSVEKIIDQRKSIEEQGRQLWRERQKDSQIENYSNNKSYNNKNKLSLNKFNNFNSNQNSTIKTVQNKQNLHARDIGSSGNLLSGFNTTKQQNSTYQNDNLSNYKSVKFSEAKNHYSNFLNNEVSNHKNDTIKRRQYSEINLPLKKSLQLNNYTNSKNDQYQQQKEGIMSDRYLDSQYKSYTSIRNSPQRAKPQKDRQNLKQFQSVISRLENKLETMSKGYDLDNTKKDIKSNQSQIY